MVIMFRRFVVDYLNFTGKERVGIVCLLLVIFACLVFPFFFSFFITPAKNDTANFEKEINSLNIKQRDSGADKRNRSFDESNYQNYYQPSEKNYYTKQPKGELFYFDPNTLPVDGWVKLGVKEKTANSIHKYVSKGGRFNKPEDISKIWGLSEYELARLIPFVKIASIPQTDYSAINNTETFKTYDKPKFKIEIIDINEADTSTFIALPGIGSKLANRIVSFREKLGGFHTIEQIAETYALPDSTYQKIKVYLTITNTEVKKLNINTASVEELKLHPYIRYNLANAIVQYRSQHGAFSSVDGLKNISIVNEEIYKKTSPYLAVH